MSHRPNPNAWKADSGPPSSFLPPFSMIRTMPSITSTDRSPSSQRLQWHRALRQACAVVGLSSLAGLSLAAGGETASPRALRPEGGVMFRWWWPGAQVDPFTLGQQLQALGALPGVRGVEIADVPSAAGDIDAQRFGWGTAAWVQAVEASLQQGARHGLQVDLTIGPHWPSALPSITPDHPAAAKELVFGQHTVAGGTTVQGEPPAPLKAPAADVHQRQLVALQAWRCVERCDALDHRVLDRSSLIDLTASVRQGQFRWTAPREGTWVVIAFWMRGTGQTVNLHPIQAKPFVTAPQSYTVDHWGRAGAEAVTRYWDQHLLPASTRAALQRHGGALFEDSLELKSERHWTAEFTRAFQRERGYALGPYLPLLATVTPPSKGPKLGPFGEPLPEGLVREAQLPAFDLTGIDRERFFDDYHLTLSALYQRNRLLPLRDWAHQRGLQWRVQPYGPTIDSSAAALLVDIPEGESLGFGSTYLRGFRNLAGAAHVAGKPILSDECCAHFNGAYRFTWKETLRDVYGNYAGGVNQIVFHGLAYPDAGAATLWPGWSPFTPFMGMAGFAEPWGPRSPGWLHAPLVLNHLSHTQRVLQGGQPRVDVAVYRHAFDVGATGLMETSHEGRPTG